MIQKKRVIAGIVTYNPDIKLLKKNILSIKKVIDTIIIVDNSSENISDIYIELKNIKLLEIIPLKKNMGIAKALNIIMECGKNRGAEWVLTMDQDSIIPQNIISDNEILLDNNSIGIIIPVIKDRNIMNYHEHNYNEHYQLVDEGITSASLNSIEIWSKVGKFDEKLFIDLVDIEYCHRVRKNGYKIVRNNKVVISHAIGNIKEIRILGKWLIISNHSAERKYYQVRNTIYIDKKERGHFSLKTFRKIMVMYALVLLGEKNKCKKFIQMNKGIIDGMKMR